MDESVINGANLFFAPQFHIDPNSGDQFAGRNQWLLGLVNSAPYVSPNAPWYQAGVTHSLTGSLASSAVVWSHVG